MIADVLNLWGRFRDYVTIGLAASTLLASSMWYVTDLRLEACESSKDAVIESTRAAAAEATLEAVNDKNRIEQEYRNHAAEQDEAYRDLLGRYNASLMRYANRSTPSRSAAPTEGGGAGSVDSPSEDPVVSDDVAATSGLILIPFSDAEICAENTARLQVAREWALGLQEIE